jgi:4-hydroxybenzoate polyprenyltransferase
MKKLSFSNAANYFKLIRITSWPKNFFVLVPAIFSKHIFETAFLKNVILAFFVFSLASSIVYIFNDIMDASKDAIHPLKKDRPIAKGKVTKGQAGLLMIVLFVIFLIITVRLKYDFVMIVWCYIILNILYTLFFKKIVIVDIFCIASGFMLRVLAGAFIISVLISNWLILTTMFLSLFLAVMKRRVEIASSPNALEQRDVLKDYSLNFTDQIGAITASGVILSYALYSVADRTVKSFGTEGLVYTTIFVIFGIFRYMYLVYKKEIGENVIEVLLTDLPMMINLILYVLTTVYIIYLRY